MARITKIGVLISWALLVCGIFFDRFAKTRDRCLGLYRPGANLRVELRKMSRSRRAGQNGKGQTHRSDRFYVRLEQGRSPRRPYHHKRKKRDAIIQEKTHGGRDKIGFQLCFEISVVLVLLCGLSVFAGNGFISRKAAKAAKKNFCETNFT